MKRFILWKLAVLLGAIALIGCPSGGGEEAEGSGEEAAGEEAAGEEAAGDEAAGEEAAGEEAAGDEAAPATQDGAAETQPAGEEAAGSGDDAAAAEAAPAGDAPESVTAENLHGTWDADMQATLANLPEEERAMAQMFLASAEMALTFNADGTMNMNVKMMGEEKAESGAFSVASSEGNVLTISATTTGEGGAEETQTMTITFSTIDTIEMRDTESPQAFVFKRRA